MKTGGYEDPINCEVLPAVKRIVVLGDTHGDFRIVLSAFVNSGLITINTGVPVWIAKDTYLVQVGDQIDSCRPSQGYDCHNKHMYDMNEVDEAEDFQILRFFYHMDQLARPHGSRVFSLLGNHELLNVINDFRYVSKANMNQGQWPGYPRKGSNDEYRQSLFKRGGPIATWLATTAKSVVIIGSNIFVHAGILPDFIKEIDHIGSHTEKIHYLNKLIRLWLLNKLQPQQEKVLLRMLDNKVSPFWQRIHGAIPKNKKMTDTQCAKYLKPVLETLKVNMMVIGHTPQIDNGSDVNATCFQDSKPGLVRTDGGFSRAFRFLLQQDVDLQLVEILDDKHVSVKTYDKLSDFNLIRKIKQWTDAL